MQHQQRQLILIRHAHAETKTPQMEDAERSLDTQGFDEISLTGIYLHALLGTSIDPVLWSSPLKRAMQSASVLADIFGKSEITTKEFLIDGNFEPFMQAFKSLDDSKTLIVIGHEPYLSQWIKLLSDKTIKLPTGCAMALDLDDANPGIAHFSFWIDPSLLIFEQLPINRRQAAHESFRSLLDFQMQNVILALKDFELNPQEPETVHQFRIRVRSLGSIMTFIRPLIRNEPLVEIQLKLSEQADTFSPLRDMDVLIETWEQFKASHPQLDYSVRFTDVLKEQRQKILDQTQTSDIADSLIDIRNWIQTYQSNIVDNFETFVRDRFENQYRKTFKRLPKLDYENLESIHDLRLRMKSLRYISEVVNPWLKIASKDDVGEFIRLQALLGTLCDIHQNLIVLKRLEPEFKDPECLREANILLGYLLAQLDLTTELNN